MGYIFIHEALYMSLSFDTNFKAYSALDINDNKLWDTYIICIHVDPEICIGLILVNTEASPQKHIVRLFRPV